MEVDLSASNDWSGNLYVEIADNNKYRDPTDVEITAEVESGPRRWIMKSFSDSVLVVDDEEVAVVIDFAGGPPDSLREGGRYEMNVSLGAEPNAVESQELLLVVKAGSEVIWSSYQDVGMTDSTVVANLPWSYETISEGLAVLSVVPVNPRVPYDDAVAVRVVDDGLYPR